MPQQKKSLKILLLALTLLSSCKRYSPPETELCAAYPAENILVCNAPYSDPQDYEREIELGDLCTNPRDYQRIREYAIDLREKLIRCERKSR